MFYTKYIEICEGFALKNRKLQKIVFTGYIISIYSEKLHFLSLNVVKNLYVT